MSDDRVNELEQMSYDEYLCSPEWAALRDTAVKAAGGRCRLCNYHKGLHVHHRYYCKRGTETQDALTVLCGPCHEMFHKNLTLYAPIKKRLEGQEMESIVTPRTVKRRRERRKPMSGGFTPTYYKLLKRFKKEQKEKQLASD